MGGVAPQDPLGQGGILHAIVGSLIEIAIAVIVTLPLGVGTAVYMTEVGGRFAKVVRTVVEAMTALPSIIAGLFIYTVLIVDLRLPQDGLCRRDGAVGHDAADHCARGRGRAASRSRRPARGQPGARRVAVADGLARRPADRAARPGHRA